MNRKTIRKIAGPAVMRGVDAVRHELKYGPPAMWDRWVRSRDVKSRRKKLLTWFDQLHANPPDVLMGANVSLSNGIRSHIEGIRRNSSMKIELSPPDTLLGEISYHDLHTTFHDEVMAFEPRGVLAMHSHVYPYFVRWCSRHRDSGPLWVHTYHSPYFPIGGELEPWQAETNDVLTAYARHAHVRISVSKWQQRYLEDKHGIETIHIPNGVDAEQADLASGDRFRELFEVDQFVLHVGRNEPVKNPGDFVRLARQMPEIRFVAIGPGLEAGTLEENFGSLPSNLVALGPLSREQVHDAMAACGALVMTSIWEGFPTVALEAMLHARRVVVPDNEGCVEAVDDGRLGFVYAQGDLADLEMKTRAALDFQEPAEEARRWVVENYDWKVLAPRIDEIYRSAGER